MRVRHSYHTTALIVLGGLFILIDTWGHISRAYETAWWIDIVTHLIFGAWLALALLYTSRWQQSHPLFVFAVVVLVGVGWELVEYLRDTLWAIPHGISPAQHGVADTVRDILDNGLGAAAALLFAKR